ncbi:putative transcriptional regulator [Herbaspirillum sp. CF444]|uniref:winged helix-turn-helix transcriptional regulator n=1 Tax=Herbaspirillum sp. CF444 TaxID=1144319 RepID=UPI0002726892|nr:helix-turn-helix domain-containing protein [Herbaspirillum sp. CF444]EJL92841.1 putative transcriptional regulator [Herbaspirillum sp. CF444]
MERKSFGNMQCPVARTLERVGEWWSILILRDAMHGLTRFDQFQKSLDIAPNMLTRRLNSLVESGLLERRQYSERPPRHEYVLTDLGRDFRSILVALNSWGNKHFAPEGPSVLLVDSTSGEVAEPIMVDRKSGKPLSLPEFVFAPGPQANESMIRRINFARERAAAANDGAENAVGQAEAIEPAAPVKAPRKKAAKKSA